MQLPKIKDNDPAFQILQDKWAAILNPVIALPLSSSNILSGIVLKTGDNVINHLLARQMQGWMITDINAASTIYRNAPLNAQTITLNSSAACSVNLLVF